MTNDDIKKLAEALQHKENAKDSKVQINKVLRNKSCVTIIREFKHLMPEIPNKDRSKSLLILVLSILHKNVGLFDNLQKVLTTEGLIPNLYGALYIFFSGKNPTLHLKIELTDSQFPNQYDYLTRFSGQLTERKIREVLYAVKILAMSDQTKFEKLAFKDSTRLILLNMTSFQLNEFPSDTLIMRLLRDGDELQANIGFYFAVWDITRDIHDYEQLRKNPTSPYTKSKRQINKNIKCHLGKFYNFYNCCSTKRKASLLINYILTERKYPVQFGYWIMEATLQEVLIFEISSSNKITNLDKLCTIAHLIHDFPCRDNNGVRMKKDKLYVAVIMVLKNFILEKKGIYSWDTSQENIFRNICQVMPQRYLKQLHKFLEKISKELMVSKLDEMVRFSIYLEDKRRWDIYQGMIDVIDSSIKQCLT